MHKKRICPICGNQERDFIFKQNFAEIPGITFLKGYDVVKCGTCGFYYADGIPEQHSFDTYYKDQSKYEDVADTLSDAKRIRFEQSLAFIVDHVSKQGMDFQKMKIADIGCATGDFLRFLKEEGYCDLTGIDPSPACVDFLRECGLAAKQAVVNELNGEEHFDLIRLNMVLEHVVDLNGFIEHIKQELLPGGFLYVSVPSVEGFSQVDNCPFQEFSVEHINYFSAQSLENFMNKYSFRLLGYHTITGRASSEMEALFVLDDSSEALESIEKDTSADEQIQVYLRKCENLEKEVNKKLNQLAQSQEPVIVWGVGTHTLRQLAVGNLAKCNIRMFVDANPHYQNTKYQGIPVRSPKEINGGERIIVSSWHAQDAIIHYGRERLGLKNEFVTLYDR